jgi:glycosyltransferase involved in cell wall biosynthesis
MVAPTSFFSDYGCSVRILEEVRALQGLGHQVTVCTYRNGKDVPGLIIRRTPSIPFREHYEVGSSLHLLAFDFLLFWVVLYQALRQRPDLIHAHMHEGAAIGLAVSRLLRLPMVFDFQGSLTGEMVDHNFLRRESRWFRPLRWLEKMLDRLSPIILTSSTNAKQLLVTEFGCDPQKIHIVADCVDANTFFPATEREEPALARRRASLGIPPRRKIVVYLGLLADYQGTDALLRAAVKVLQHRDDVHFLIMGFPAVQHYQQMAHRLGVDGHATFTGKVLYQEARNYLAMGDIAVAPKLSETEGSGKILNYMAMGLPTVAFDTPVSREYLGDEGIYATPGDPDSLARALLGALSDPIDVDLGSALRKKSVDAFAWDHAARIILHAYKSACHS